jgi:hemerythrin
MERFGFTGLAEHRTEHQQFAKEAADLMSRAENGSLIMTITILAFLKDWLNNHILGTDMKYVQLFKQQGLV